MTPYGSTKSVHLFVGLKRGEKSTAQRGAVCERLPKQLQPRTVDRAVVSAWKETFEKGTRKLNVSMSRVAGRGWWQGKAEPSHQYTVFLDGENEQNLASLTRNLTKAAEIVADKLCQDSIIVVSDDGDKRRSYGVTRKANKK